MQQSIIHCTSNAHEQLKSKLEIYKLETGLDAYIEISIRHRGCSGLSYEMQFTTEPDAQDYIIKDLNLSIKADSLMWVMGTYMDYESDDLNSGFIFTNPHQKRKCHCGEAFYL